MFPVSYFPISHFPGLYFPPGGSVQQIAPPVIPLPGVSGVDFPDYLTESELDDERVVLEMIELFLKGQN